MEEFANIKGDLPLEAEGGFTLGSGMNETPKSTDPISQE